MNKHKSWPVHVEGRHGGWSVESPKLGPLDCPNHALCGGSVVYNGNYFCEFLELSEPTEPSPQSCNWALSDNGTNGVEPQDEETWEEIQDRWEEIHGVRFD